MENENKLSSQEISDNTLKIQKLIYQGKKDKTINVGLLSDDNHTFDELYESRNILFITLCRSIAMDFTQPKENHVWRTKVHSDGRGMDRYFILGIGDVKGKQMTFHLPIKDWEETEFATTLERAPEWDKHTSEDVLKRLKTLNK